MPVGCATISAPMKPQPISAIVSPPIRSRNNSDAPSSTISGVICPSAVASAIGMLASATT